MPTPTPDGSGAGSGSGQALRRLMRYVGTRDGRPVYVGTLCNPAGPRRLMRYVGEYPAFWTGGGSGSGELVPSRPVYASAECITGDAIPAGGPLECCPAGYGPNGADWPGVIRARFDWKAGTKADGTAAAGPGVACCSLDGLEVPIYYTGLDGWALDRLVIQGGCSGINGAGPYDLLLSLYFTCQGVSGVSPTKWSLAGSFYRMVPGSNHITLGAPASINVTQTFGSFCLGCDYLPPFDCASPLCVEFGRPDPADQCPGPGTITPGPDADPRCPVTVQQQMIGPANAGGCQDGVAIDFYQVTVWDPAMSDGSCPPGSGSGSGSGWGSGSGSGAAFRNRALMRHLGARAGRPVYIGTCCPPSGSGGASGVPCEPDPVPDQLVGHIVGGNSATCPLFASGVSLVLARGGDSWSGSMETACGDLALTLTCTGAGEWNVTATLGANSLGAANPVAPGFPLTTTGHVVGECASCNVGTALTITILKP